MGIDNKRNENEMEYNHEPRTVGEDDRSVSDASVAQFMGQTFFTVEAGREAIKGEKITSEDKVVAFLSTKDRDLPPANHILEAVIDKHGTSSPQKILIDDDLKGMKYCVKTDGNGRKIKFGAGDSWKNDTLEIYTYERDSQKVTKWLKDFLQSADYTGGTTKKRSAVSLQSRESCDETVEAPVTGLPPGALKHHERLRVMAKDFKTVDTFKQNFINFKGCIERLEILQQDKNREAWAYRWSMHRSSTDPKWKSWADACNADRKTLTVYLFALVDLCRGDTMQSKMMQKQLVEILEPEIVRIVAVCMVMDMFQALFGLVSPKDNRVGKTWYAEAQKDYMQQIGAVPADCDRHHHPMNRRYLLIFQWFEEHAEKSVLHHFKKWTKPTLTPKLKYPASVEAAVASGTVRRLSESYKEPVKEV